MLTQYYILGSGVWGLVARENFSIRIVWICVVSICHFYFRNNLLSINKEEQEEKAELFQPDSYLGTHLPLLLGCKEPKGSDQVLFIWMFSQDIAPHKYIPSNGFF